MDADLRLEPVAGGRSEAKPPSHAPAAIFGQRPRIGYRAALPGSTASKLFFNRDRQPLGLDGQYRGRSVFLIAGGPSFATVNHSLLRRPGLVTMGLNNAVKTFRPNLWVSVDEPDHFLRSIWLDPAILKFSPLEYAGKPIFNSDTWTFMQLTAGDCPNVAFFRRNDQFQAEHFLRQDSINWGNHRRYGGGRSVLLAALRILFILGFRRVFLLGVDFEMNEGYRYHFDQSRAGGSISGNNSTYEKLKGWLAELRPVLERDKFFVFNCNPASRLTAFEHVPVTEAVGMVLREEFDGVDIGAERTQGLYDTSAGDKRSGTSQTPGA